MSLFNGVENFTPALEGQRIAIGAGSAMRQGLQGIEQIGEQKKMKAYLDQMTNSINNHLRTPPTSNAYEIPTGSTAGSDDWGTLPTDSGSNADYGGLEG